MALGIIFSTPLFAADLSNDTYIGDHARIAMFQQNFYRQKISSPYTLLDAEKYKKTVESSRQKIKYLLQSLSSKRNQHDDQQITFIVQKLLDIPYAQENGMGEGDWQPSSTVYKPGAVHLNQNPVYRLDNVNCQTFVQIVMALLYSYNLVQFDKNYLKISYGAAGNPAQEIVRYYNRNNFVDADFNPVNQRNGLLTDATSSGMLAPYSKTIHATITRQKWFLNQQKNLADNVLVLHHAIGPRMVQRFTTIYSKLDFPHFNSEEITMSYIPKEWLAIKQTDGGFKPNQTLLKKIPTPAIVEMVRDVKKWNLFGIKIKDLIGSELTISHMGLLYKQTFKYNELIYYKTTCTNENTSYKTCNAAPVTCQKSYCNELMFAHATNALPMNYFWYQKSNGDYVCSPRLPAGTTYTRCNRVVALPFYDYLTDYQLGYYQNMDMPSLIGIHIEKLRSRSLKSF